MTTTGAPPARPVPGAVTGDLNRIQAALNAQIPAKTDTNLLIGTWNLRAFGDLTPYDAFISTGLWPPAELNDVPRTIFNDEKGHHHYDQIAWFSDPHSLMRHRSSTG